MKTRVCLSLAACASLAVFFSGCGTAPVIARGQQPSGVQQAGFGTQPHIGEAIGDHLHGTAVSHYRVPTGDVTASSSAGAGWDGSANCPPQGAGNCPANCPPDAGCPHCKGCPPAGQTCPFCQNGNGHDGHHHFNPIGVRHQLTYSYHRPHNLSYPPPEVPGGAVVYPYYTLKGPSDFFRAH